VVDVSLLTRTLDVDFNGVTVVVDVSLLCRVYPLFSTFHLLASLSKTQVADVDINGI
jgi:hypothetical protein